MTNLVLELMLMFSLAVIVYLMAAAVPRMDDEEKDDVPRTNLPLDKLDSFLIKAKDKLLRRVKVVVMKTDNLISEQLKSKKD